MSKESTIDISKLSYDDVRELQAKLASREGELRVQAKMDAKAKIEAVLQQTGFTLQELFPNAVRGQGKAGRANPRAGKPVPAKYANPANPSETWTGRGKQPAWYSAAVASGKSEADLRIP